METNSLLVHHFLVTPECTHIEFDLQLDRYIALLKRDWEVEVKHVYREANVVADVITNWALSQELGYHLLPTPPVPIRSLLFADLARITHPRLVSSCILEV